MSKISEVEKEDVEIDERNIPTENLNGTKIYKENNYVKEKILELLPEVRGGVRGVVASIVVLVSLYLIGLEIMSNYKIMTLQQLLNSPRTLIKESNTIVFIIGSILLIISFIITGIAIIRNWASGRKLYIISDDYIIETYSGTGERNKKSIKREDIENIIVKDSKLKIESSDDYIEIYGDLNETKKIKNSIYNI